MVTADDAPTTNVSGTVMACGSAVGDWITSVTGHAPRESPAGDAEMLMVSDVEESVSQSGFAGSTATVHGAPEVTLRLAVAAESKSVTEAGDTASAGGDVSALV